MYSLPDAHGLSVCSLWTCYTPPVGCTCSFKLQFSIKRIWWWWWWWVNMLSDAVQGPEWRWKPGIQFFYTCRCRLLTLSFKSQWYSMWQREGVHGPSVPLSVSCFNQTNTEHRSQRNPTVVRVDDDFSWCFVVVVVVVADAVLWDVLWPERGDAQAGWSLCLCICLGLMLLWRAEPCIANILCLNCIVVFGRVT